MKLVSFHIKECFGFRDSDRIDLHDPTNLIYILGRNSSGKTSLLTALAHFAQHRKPQSYENFVNFDPASEEPSLLAEYTFEKDIFRLDTFFTRLFSEIDTFNQGSNALITSKEYKAYKDALRTKLIDVYNRFFDPLKIQTRIGLNVMRQATIGFRQPQISQKLRSAGSC